MSKTSHQKLAKTGVPLFFLVAGMCSVTIPIITSLIVVQHVSMPDRAQLFDRVIWLPFVGVGISSFCAGVTLLLILLLTIRWIC